jgi:hypothetical protein
MSSEASTNIEPLDLEQQKAKAAILAARQELETAGITLVVMEFDGSGDEGINEDAKCYNSATDDYKEPDPVEHDVSDLQEHFETLVPYGYEIGCGGFGEVVFEVRSGEIRITRNDRFEDYSTESYQV